MSGIFDSIVFPIREPNEAYIKSVVERGSQSVLSVMDLNRLDFHIANTELKTHGAIEGVVDAVDRMSVYDLREEAKAIYERANTRAD